MEPLCRAVAACWEGGSSLHVPGSCVARLHPYKWGSPGQCECPRPSGPATSESGSPPVFRYSRAPCCTWPSSPAAG